MAHSGRGAPKHLGPAVDMSRHSQCLYKARGSAGVMQRLWSHQETAGENSGAWRTPETGRAGQRQAVVSRQRKESVSEAARWDVKLNTWSKKMAFSVTGTSSSECVSARNIIKMKYSSERWMNQRMQAGLLARASPLIPDPSAGREGILYRKNICWQTKVKCEFPFNFLREHSIFSSLF